MAFNGRNVQASGAALTSHMLETRDPRISVDRRPDCAFFLFVDTTTVLDFSSAILRHY